jgi:hypothetical protein
MKWKIIYFSMVSILLLVLFLEITKNVEKYDNITTTTTTHKNKADNNGKPYIRTIILIIASNGNKIFDNGRKIWKKLNKDKCLFILITLILPIILKCLL